MRSVKLDGKGKQVYFYTEKLPGGISGVPCSLFSGQRYNLIISEHPATFLRDHGPDSICSPLVKLQVAPSLGSQGMILRLRDNIFRLFSGVSRRRQDMVYGFMLRCSFILKTVCSIGESHSFLDHY